MADFLKSKRLDSVIQQVSLLYPRSIAVSDGSRTLTYKSLDELSDQVAKKIIELQLPLQTVIAVLCDRSVDAIVAMLAIMKSGHIYLPIDCEYPEERIRYLLSDSKASVLLVDEKFKETKFDNQKVIIDCEIVEKKAFSQYPLKSENDIAYMIYTSGSTGNPKGVVVEHRSVMNLLNWINSNTKVKECQKTLQFSSFSFDPSILEIFSTLVNGKELVITTVDERKDITALMNLIDEQKIERLFLPIAIVQLMSEEMLETSQILSCIKEINCGGDSMVITPAIRQAFTKIPGIHLNNQYGPTEATIMVTHLCLNGNPELWEERPGLGLAVANSELLVVSEDLEVLAKDQVGELLIGGGLVSKGYWNREELTQEKFILREGKRFYKTGDLVHFDQDLVFHFHGRIDRQVKINGVRVECGEVESLINQVVESSESSVLLINAQTHKYLAAFIRGPFDSTVVKDFLKSKLPVSVIPTRFVSLEQFPLTSNGKIDRDKIAHDHLAESLIATPKSAEKNELLQLIIDVTGLLQLSEIESFFEVGMTSLQAIKCVSKINRKFKTRISIADFFAHSSVAELTSFMQEDRSITIKRREKTSHSRQVAVIGMNCRFPEAESLTAFWKMIEDGSVGINVFAKDELNKKFTGHLLDEKEYVAARGVLSNIDQIDASFFGLSPRVAELFDPQMRLMMELGHQTLEAAGISPEKTKSTIGVYAGMSNNNYFSQIQALHPEKINSVGEWSFATFNEKDYIATQMAYKLNLKGPALSIHAACSTSLVAIGQAARAIQSGDCDVALAGGVHVNSYGKVGHLYQEGGIFSRDGQCRPFDESATGTLFSDGIGLVVLKDLESAEKDGDTIYAVIKGIGLNNDGSDKSSFTAPSLKGQRQAIAQAMLEANIEPSSIGMIETHGTATPVGDPIEVQALSEAYEVLADKVYVPDSTVLSSVKAQIGHTVAAAGVAGFIKTVLCLQNKKKAGTVHFTKLNPLIDFSNTPFTVSAKNQDWVESKTPRRAAVSSFGVGGTNAHIVLEEYIDQRASIEKSGPFLFSFSARTQTSLCSQLVHWLAFLKTEGKEQSLENLSYTLLLGRNDYQIRWSTVASDHTQLISRIEERLKVETDFVQTNSQNKIVFGMPGQGGQYKGMGLNLYKNHQSFKSAMDKCQALMLKHFNTNLLDLVFNLESEKINQTVLTQPAIFCFQYAMAQTLISFGIKPSMVIGHSVGEFCGAVLSGIMTLEEALVSVSVRAQLMESMPTGSMLTIKSTAQEVESILQVHRLNDKIQLAAMNAVDSTVVGGNEREISTLEEILSQQNIMSKRLVTSHAFHTAMMEPMIPIFEKSLLKIEFQTPKLKFISTTLGKSILNNETSFAGYWANHVRQTVRFTEALHTLLNESADLLIDLGPRTIITQLSSLAIKKSKTQLKNISTNLSKVENESEALMVAIGKCWEYGVEIQTQALFTSSARKIVCPGYAFEKKSYWAGYPLSQNNNFINSQKNNQPELSKEFSMSDLNKLLINDLVNVMAEQSGLEVNELNPQASFLEIGLDSLLLTQIALDLSKRYQINITFRQMMDELTSIASVAEFFISTDSESIKKRFQTEVNVQAPAPVSVATPTPVVTQKSTPVQIQAATPTQTFSGTGIETLIAKQLDLMRDQLALMSGAQISAPQTTAQEVASPKVETASKVEAKVEIKNEELELPKADVNTAKTAFGAQARINTVREGLSSQEQQSVQDIMKRYMAQTSKSKAFTQATRAKNADPRVVTGFRPEIKEIIYPVVVNKSVDQHLWDIDGNEYIDVTCGFGSNFFGNQNPRINAALHDQLDRGMEIGPQTELVGVCSELICEMTGSDRAAFCNTGSEAVLGALRIARTITGRKKIVMFKGSYHGINDEVIVRGLKDGKAMPAAAGINPSGLSDIIVLDYGTPEAIERIKAEGSQIAAVIVEPVQSRRSDFRPIEFLKEVRAITEQNGTAFIFDEVITGFRIAPGGAQEYFGIRADLATYGKIIGGGMPIGVIAGKSRFMDALDGGFWSFGDDSTPTVALTYFAGTFVRHPLAMRAMKEALLILKEGGQALYNRINKMSQEFVAELNLFAEMFGAPIVVDHFGGVLKPRFSEIGKNYDLFYALMRMNGVHCYDGFPWFVTLAHTDQDLRTVADTFKKCIIEMQQLGLFPSRFQNSRPTQSQETDFIVPPAHGAVLRKDESGRPAWFKEDVHNPGQYVKISMS